MSYNSVVTSLCYVSIMDCGACLTFREQTGLCMNDDRVAVTEQSSPKSVGLFYPKCFFKAVRFSEGNRSSV